MVDFTTEQLVTIEKYFDIVAGNQLNPSLVKLLDCLEKYEQLEFTKKILKEVMDGFYEARTISAIAQAKRLELGVLK